MKALDITLENCLDIKQICDERDPEFFVKQNVKIGVARWFVNEIKLWVNYRINQPRQVGLMYVYYCFENMHTVEKEVAFKLANALLE